MRALILLFFLPLIGFSQVGINTTSPNASLDIKSSNQATPTNTDGVLIPKIDEYPSANPTAAQDGMLVFATGTGSVSKGFYYWDNITTSWKPFSGTTVEKINDLIDGKSDNDGSSIFLGKHAGANDDGTNNGNVGVGFRTLEHNSTGFNNSAFGRAALYNNSTGDYNVALGTNSGALTNGNKNVFLGYETGGGAFDTKDGSVFVGYQAGYSEDISNRLYIENTNSTTPLIYGEFDNDLLRVNGDFEVEKTTDASITVKTPFGDTSSLKLFESGGSGDYGFEFQYDGSSDKFHLWSRTFAGNESIRMTWLKNGKVGINDISPTALLDIEAANRATPTNTDGILIPRIDAFPSSNPTATQNGMLVFLTTNNTFYFWRNSGTSWVPINSGGPYAINDLSDGKSDDDGSNNGSSVFLGTNAGAVDDSSDNRNVGVGFQTLQANSNGSTNTALGYQSMLSNTSGYNNVAVGTESLFSNSSGHSNVAIGDTALYANTTGDANIAIGWESLKNNTIGNDNIALGYRTLYNNHGGSGNVAIGREALYTVSAGSQNTAVGYEALQLNTGSYNTALGYTALDSNTNAIGNTAIGNRALTSNTTGDYNVSIGYRAMIDNISGENNIAMGFHALQNNTSGNYNVAIGTYSLQNNSTVNNNTAIGHSAASTNTVFTNITALGYNAEPNSPNQVRIGNASVAIIGGSANWSNISDRRLKTNIKENISGLDFIKKLRPVSYNLDMDAIARFEKTPDSLRLRDAEQLKANEIQTGFIAQEVEAAAKEVGFDFHGIVRPYDSNGTYALRYSEFVVPLVKAMQEQQDIIEAQKEELKAIRLEIEEIKALLKKD